MLRVTIEVVPFGNESKREVLHTVEIANTLQVPESKRHLTHEEWRIYRIAEWAGESLVTNRTRQVRHDRIDGALVLVEKALRALNGGQTP